MEESKTGTVIYKEFREALKNMGYEAGFQNEIDLGRPDIFNETNMIFTICDEWGRPVGFAARNLTYSEEKDEDGKPKNGTKYTNQKMTGLRCNIYQKGRRLYEIHIAKKYTPPLYIVEGYTDVLTAQRHGIFNCAAIGGTAFTQDHIELLKRRGMYDIILCLDGDQAGIERVEKLLDERFCGNKDMKVSIVNLPDGMDPDDFLREKGKNAFLGLKKFSAFEWRLNRCSEEDDPQDICNTMIPLIVNEPSYIAQDSMCGALSIFTGVDFQTIKNELERLQNERARVRARETEAIVDQSFNDIRRNPGEAKSLLLEAANAIEEVEEKYNESALSIENFRSFVMSQKTEEEALSGEFAGFYLSEVGLATLGNYLNGNWREDAFMCIGGKENTGKSSLCVQFAYQIASDERNDACVIYHTIDDSAQQILPRFVVQCYGDQDLTLNQVRNPKYFQLHQDDETVFERRAQGYRELMKLIGEGRIVVKDVNDGASLAFGESLVRHYVKKYPNRNIVYILDNLHKAPDYGNNSKEVRTKYKKLSNHIKKIATKYHICVLATAEYTKLPPGIIPTNNNIAESRAFQYDANFIGHMYNDLHESGSAQAKCYHTDDKSGRIMPRVRLGIGKNKITDFKGRLFFDFYPASGLFRQVDTIIAENDMRNRMRELNKLRQGRRSVPFDQYEGTTGKPGSEGDEPS
jgi:DNA primase